ncbi:hypothetical protein ABZ260_25030 [Streptosporangium sp. NPDC006013]|uniref:hypothetical protein n=1 Tax=Streptosporangium sp. NPDC006013 TaxID=3155596 RepID=UPI0033A41989
MATLKTPEGRRYSELERLRRPPTKTGTAFAPREGLRPLRHPDTVELDAVELDDGGEDV